MFDVETTPATRADFIAGRTARLAGLSFLANPNPVLRCDVTRWEKETNRRRVAWAAGWRHPISQCWTCKQVLDNPACPLSEALGLHCRACYDEMGNEAPDWYAMSNGLIPYDRD